MVGWFTSHDIASCEEGREGRRGIERQREREREGGKRGRKGAAAVGNSSQAAFQSRLHLGCGIDATLEDEVRSFVLNVVVPKNNNNKKKTRAISIKCSWGKRAGCNCLQMNSGGKNDLFH